MAQRNQRQHFAFPLRDPLEEAAAEAGRGRGIGRREIVLAGGHGANGADELGGQGLFEHESRGAGQAGQPEVGVVVVHREDQNLGPGYFTTEVLGGVDASPAGHGQVHDHHVRGQAAAAFQRRRAVFGLADHLEVGLRLEQRLERRAHQRMVIRNQNAHAVHPASCRGMSAITVVPLPGWESTQNEPPTSVTRSSMPSRPR